MKIIFLIILPILLYLSIKYPTFVFSIFFSAASLEGGFVSEVRFLTLTRLSFLILIPAFLFIMLKPKRWQRYDCTNLILIWGFILFYLFSFFWSYDPVRAFYKVRKLSIILTVCVMSFFIFKNALLSEFKLFIRIYIIATMILLVYLYSHLGEMISLAEESRRTAQRIAPYNANAFGKSLVIAISMSMGLAYANKREVMVKIATVLLIILGLPLIIMAGSRSSVVILFFICVASLLIYWWLCQKKELIRSGLIAVAVGLVIFGGIFLTRSRMPENVSVRINRILLEPTAVIKENARLQFLGESIVLLESVPFFGMGLRGYEQVMQYPHNIVVEVFVETGVVGGAFLLFCAALLLLRYLKLLKVAYDNEDMWFPCLFSLFLAVIGSWSFAMLTGEITDHRLSFFLGSLLIACEYQIRKQKGSDLQIKMI